MALFAAATTTAFAATSAAAAVTTAATATTTTLGMAGHLAHIVDLILFAGFAYLLDMAHKVQVHASQWVIDVANYFVLGDFLDGSLDDVTILVLQRYLSALHHKLREELAGLWVTEELLRQSDDLLLIIFAVSLGWSQDEVECVASLLALDLLLEARDQLADTKDEGKWMSLLGLFDFFDFGLLACILWSFVTGEFVMH